jgi:hypothetical protein
VRNPHELAVMGLSLSQMLVALIDRLVAIVLQVFERRPSLIN